VREESRDATDHSPYWPGSFRFLLDVWTGSASDVRRNFGEAYKPGSAPGATPGPAPFGCTPEAGHFSAARTGVALPVRWAYNVGPAQIVFAVPSRSPDADPPGGPGVVEVFEKQLGLRVEKKRITIDVIVVDSPDKIPEN
jgi:hypothetical protein